MWLTDYQQAVRQGKEREKMVLIHFTPSVDTAAEQRLRNVTLRDPKVTERLGDYVCLRISIDGKVKEDKAERLVSHPSFAHLRGAPGLAIIDFHDPDSPHWHHVVTQMPFRSIGYPNSVQMRVILDLPHGSLTQRTMVYAVRMHPEGPASTRGTWDPMLAIEAEQHSRRQANLRRQGHHEWNHRFSPNWLPLAGGALCTGGLRRELAWRGIDRSGRGMCRFVASIVGPLECRASFATALWLRHQARRQRHLVCDRNIRESRRLGTDQRRDDHYAPSIRYVR